MAGWFTGRNFDSLERLDPSEARARSLQSTLDKVRSNREALEFRRSPLSPANQFHLVQLKNFELKFSRDIEARRREVLHLEKSGRAGSRRHIAAISWLSNRLQQRTLLRTRADAERRRNALNRLVQSASAGDRRFYFPGSKFFRNPRTVLGTEAKVIANRVFRNPLLSIPCIHRAVRREVMFAKRHAGKAHRVKRKFNPLSYIRC